MANKLDSEQKHVSTSSSASLGVKSSSVASVASPMLSAPHKSGAEVAANRLTALLDAGASFEGRLTFEGSLRIGGQFRGEIFSRDTLIIHAGAQVEAQIEAGVVIISGQVTGNILAHHKIIMHPPAVFRGSVISPSLRIDEGVQFEGASYMPKPTSV